LVRFALLDRTLSIEEVLGALGAGSGGSIPAEEEMPRPRGTASTAARAAARPSDAAPRRAAESSAATVQPGADAEWKRRFEEASASAPSRLTTESVRAERLASLRAQDPVLDTAIDVLDLELLD
jgi:hypothetical protein